MRKINLKRVIVFVLVSPIVVPVTIIAGLGLLLVFGIEYVLTGKYNQDDVAGNMSGNARSIKMNIVR